MRAHRRGFTLIELLIVIAIIGVLATLLLSAIFSAKGKAQVGVARSQIRAIQAALQMYEGDHGKFPRHRARPNAKPTATHECWNDDSPALYMALRNKATRDLGGGQNSPYLDWKAEAVGLLPNTNLAPGSMGENGVTGSGVTTLSPADQEKLSTASFQGNYRWESGPYLVLLDPWGNPYHYREWSSIRALFKDQFLEAPAAPRGPFTASNSGSGQAPISGSVTDSIHSPEQYDIWSNGPNGVNEYGAPGSDDVTSWSQ